MEIKYYRVYIDGIDKTGKDLIASYISQLSNYKYLIKARGILSMIAYSKLYHRNFQYDLTNENAVINILLTVNYDDWKCRYKITNEKDIALYDYNSHAQAFLDAKNELNSLGYYVPCYDTSNYTPYQIAKNIINNLERLERGEVWIEDLSQK